MAPKAKDSQPSRRKGTSKKQQDKVVEDDAQAGQLFPGERDRRGGIGATSVQPSSPPGPSGVAASSSATASSSVPHRATSVDGIDEVSFRDIRDYGVVVAVGTEMRASASDLRSVVDKGVIEVDLTDDTYIADSRSHTRTSPYTSPISIRTIIPQLSAEVHGSWQGG